MQERITIFASSFDEARVIRKSYALKTGVSSLGFSAMPFSAWLENAWDLWGSEQAIITQTERQVLFSQLLKQQAEFPCSGKFIDLLCQYSSLVFGSRRFMAALEHPEVVSESNRLVLYLFGEYACLLKAHNKIEPAQALYGLPEQAMRGKFFLSENALVPYYLQEFLDIHNRQLFLWCSQKAASSQKDFREAQASIHTPIGPLPQEKQAEFLFPAGQTAQAALLAQRLDSWVSLPYAQKLQQKGKPAVFIACNNPLQVFSELQPYASKGGFDMAATGPLPFLSTSFGSCFHALVSFLNDQNLDAVSDYLKSPFSGAHMNDAYRVNKLLRSYHRFGFEEIKEKLYAVAPHFSYMEELYSSVDASVVLDYFKDVACKTFAAHKARLAEELAAISALYSLYETARALNASISELLELVDSLVLSVGQETNEGCPHVEIGSYDKLLGAMSDEYAVVLMADLDSRFFSLKDALSVFTSLNEELSMALNVSHVHQKRSCMRAAQRSAASVFACEQVLNTPEGNETFPCFFFDEYLEHYRVQGKKVPQLSPSRCHVFEHGEEHLLGNVVPRDSGSDDKKASGCTCSSSSVQLYQEEERSNVVGRFSSGALKPAAVSDVLVTRTFLKTEKTLPSVSPSDIESYVGCPYRWFVERRIKPQTLDFEPGALEQGTFVHEVFFDFYKLFQSLGHTNVVPQNLEQAKDCLVSVFDMKLSQQQEQKSAHFLIETQADSLRAEKLKKDLLVCLERQAHMNSAYTPTLFETQVNAKGNVTYAGVNLVGRADRVDIDKKHKRFIVVDYKASTKGHKAGIDDPDNFELPEKLQALIYAQAFRQRLRGYRCQGALYMSYNAKEKKDFLAGSYNAQTVYIAGLCRDGSKVDMNFHVYLDMIEDALKPYIDQMMTGVIAPLPRSEHVCSHCLVTRCERRLS